MKHLQRLIALLCLLVLLPVAVLADGIITVNAAEYPVTRSGWYSTMEEVAVYISEYGRLPGNYITKNDATKLGWNKSAGSLWRVAPGKSIGGDRYGDYERQLPSKNGRTWKECDIDYGGKTRNGKRIVFSNDGLIYYTSNHYSSFSEVRIIRATATPRITDTPRITATPRVTSAPTPTASPEPTPIVVEEDGLYTSRDEVAMYIYEFWGLPANYITKAEARELGWSSKKDNLDIIAPGYTIGGDEFMNREGLLPATETRTWYECDVNRDDGKRSNERIVFSSDGLIYFSDDGFKSFVQLY